MQHKTPSNPCRLAGCVKGLVLAALLVPMVGSAADARKPNVIVADDPGYADLGGLQGADIKIAIRAGLVRAIY